MIDKNYWMDTPCPEQKWCLANDGVVWKEGEWPCGGKGVSTVASIFILPVPSDALLGKSPRVTSSSCVSTFSLPDESLCVRCQCHVL